MCPLTKAELRKQGFLGALKYVEWGERQVSRKSASHTVAGVPWPSVKSVVGNRPAWHCYSLKETGHFVVPALIRERFFYAYNADSLPDTNMFYHGRFDDDDNIQLQCALLNSSIAYLATEVYGRINIGGRLNMYGTEYNQLPVLNGKLLTPARSRAVVEHFQTLSRRHVMPILDEIKQPDRQAFDAAVFAGCGLAEHVALESLYADFTALVANRLSRESSEGTEDA